jgi:tetratricopeptide (TPR) repeat protein
VLTNLGVAYSCAREPKQALEIARPAAREHPRNMDLVSNLAQYELAVGNIEEGAADYHRMADDFPRPFGQVFQGIVVAEELLGHHAAVEEACRRLDTVDPALAPMVRGDLALAEGRLDDAATILRRGTDKAKADAQPDDLERIAMLQAELQLRLGNKKAAIASALTVQRAPERVFNTAQVLIAAGDEPHALEAAGKLALEKSPEARAYGLVLRAQAARLHGRFDDSLARSRDALQLLDIWEAHLEGGRALLAAKRYAEAKAELDVCIARRGEIGNGVNDLVGLRYVPAIYEDRARAEDGLGDAAAAAKDRENAGMFQRR